MCTERYDTRYSGEGSEVGEGGRGAQLCGTLDSRLRVQGQKLERTLKSAKRNQHLQVNLYTNDQCSVVALLHTGANSGVENK